MTVFQSVLNNIGTLYKRERTPDDQGGWYISYYLGGLIDCRVRPATSSERTVAQSEERSITHVFYCEVDESVYRGDRVYVDDILIEMDARRKPSQENNYLELEHLEIDCLERQYEESEVTFALLLEDVGALLLEDGGILILE